MKTLKRVQLILVFTSSLILLGRVCSQADDTSLVLTNVGNAVNHWNETGNVHFTLVPSNRGIQFSSPLTATYSFLLPPAQLIPGVREISSITVTVSGRPLGLDTSGTLQIGTNNLNIQGTTTTIQLSGADAINALVSLGDGQANRLDVLVAESSFFDGYEVDSVTANYHYTNLPQYWAQAYQLAVASSLGIATSEPSFQWGYGSVFTLAKTDFDNVIMGTLSDLLSDTLWSAVPLDIDPWLDLINAPSDLNSTYDFLNENLQQPLQWFTFWSDYYIKYQLSPDFTNQMQTTAQTLSALAATWASVSTHATLSAGDQVALDNAVAVAKATVQTLTSQMNATASELSGMAASPPNPGDAYCAQALLSSFSPLMNYDLTGHPKPDSYLLYLYAALDNARSPIITPPGDPLASGLIAYYPLDGDAGDAASTNNGTLVGSVTFVPGLFGRAAHFSGDTGSAIRINSALGNFGQSDFTISAWMRTLTGGALIEKRAACDCENMLDVRVGYRPQLQQMLFEAGEGCPTPSVSAQVGIDGDWHNVVSTRRGNQMACYVDGVMLGETTTATVADIDNAAVLTIGNSICKLDGTPVLIGDIDDLRIYNRALSETEILALFSKTAGVQPSVAPGVMIANGGFALHIEGLLGRSFTVQVSTNLVNWSVLTNFSAPNASAEVQDASATNSQYRFYRALIP